MIIVSTMKDNVNVGTEVECESLLDVGAVAMSGSWSPFTFSNKYRNRENFLQTSVFVIDVDSDCTVEEAIDKFKDFNNIILASRNHQKNKKGITCDRFRVILELDKPIQDEKTYLNTWHKAKKLWPFMDEQCKDVSRFYYATTEPLSVNKVELFGEFSVEMAEAMDVISKEIAITANDDCGDLSKSTLRFLTFGAEAGSWHGAFIKASIDMKEQGFSLAAAEELLKKPTGMLDSTDIYQLNHIYNTHDTKYEKRERQTELVVSASSLLNEMYEYLANKDALRGEPTGIESLDKMLGGGFREGELTVLMAQAKTGKNTLYHYMMHKMLNRGQKQGYASRELDPATEVLPNLLTLELSKNLWTSELTEDDKRKINKATQSWPLFFAEGYGHFPEEKLAEWIKELSLQGIKSFWIDHFHYMLDVEDHGKTAALIRSIKTLAKQLKIHINLIVQPKTIQSTEKLNFNSMRGGAAITQALDNLLILERHTEVEEKNIAQLELVVARHKIAKPGKIYLQYNETDTSFVEVIESTLSKKPQQTVDTAGPTGYTGFNKRPSLNTRVN